MPTKYTPNDDFHLDWDKTNTDGATVLTPASGDRVTVSVSTPANSENHEVIMDSKSGELTSAGKIGITDLGFDLKDGGDPAKANDIVEGTDGDDTIDVTYTGDPDGDMVDNNDNATGNNDDVIQTGDGQDTVHAGDGNDIVHGGADQDTLYGEAGNDTLYGNEGQDVLIGGAGDDTMHGGADADRFTLRDGFGNDTIVGGESGLYDDTVDGMRLTGDASVTFSGDEAGTLTVGSSTATFSEIENVETGSGNDVIDASASTTGVSVGAGAGQDTITGSSGDDTFRLGEGEYGSDEVADTVILVDGFGHDAAYHWDMPTDNGDGTFTGIDQIDVSNLHNAAGHPVTTDDVTVTFDPNGYAILHFPGGESIMLATKFPPAAENFQNEAYLNALGIPSTTSDYIVEGTAGDDVIDAAYTGDPDGDMVNNNDAADGSNDDVIYGYEGNDQIFAGFGNDEVHAGSGDDYVSGGDGDDAIYGEAGDDELYGDDGTDQLYGGEGGDTISGGAGNDVIEGNDGNDTIEGNQGDDTIQGNGGDDTILGGDGDDVIYGDSADGPVPAVPRESFNWEDLTTSEVNSSGATVTQNTGTVDVTYTLVTQTGTHNASRVEEPLNVDGIDGGTETVDDNSGLLSSISGQGNTATFQWDFSQSVENLEFNINDIDGGSTVLVQAYDAGGNQIEVQLVGGSGMTLTDTDSVAGNDTADSNGGFGETDDAQYNLQVTIPGPVARIEVRHLQDASGTANIVFTDLHFDTPDSPEPDGDDTITGGAGADEIYGGLGDDTFIVADSSDGTGDVVTGGAQGDDDHDVLDLRGAGNVIIDQQADATDAGATEGTVTFVETGETLSFSQIEEILTDPPSNAAPDAVDDNVTGAINTTIIISVLDNDNDPDGDPLTVIGATSSDGTVTILADGTLEFTPTTGLEGPAQITYTISDGNGGTDTAVVNIMVRDGIVEGTAGNDVIDTAYTGDPEGDMVDNSDAILPGEGPNDDIIYGYGGNDQVFGGLGDDEIHGGEGDDTLIGDEGNDEVYGDEGNDTLYGREGDDILHGGDGNDVLTGNEGDDTLYGGAGKDHIRANEGDDTIDGGDDDDQLYGEAGEDTIEGGAGADLIVGGADDDDISGGAGDDRLHGDNPNEPVTVHGDDTIDGGAGDDRIYGWGGDDTLTGGEGDDTIYGGVGNDTIAGGEGADTVYGDDDRDTFTNVGINDVVDGGEGGDDFDTLDLTGSAPTGGSFQVTYNPSNSENGVVTYYDDQGNNIGTMTFSNIENVIPCFTPGTLISTPSGERRVEDLRPGDRIITRDNGTQPIAWTGGRSMSRKELAQSSHLHPILIRAGALGNNLPAQDLLVSPNHRVLVANERTALYFNQREVLVSAKHLVDNKGIVQVDPTEVTYLHFMCERHEVVLSNGAWTETFQPGDYSLQGVGDAQRQELFELFPELKNREGIRDYAAARMILKKHEAQMVVAS